MHKEAAALALLSALPLAGQAAEGSVTTTLAEVVVTATRTERAIEDVPASVTVIRADEAARQQPISVLDLLRNVASVDVSGNASLAASEAIRLRGIGLSFGGSTSQVLLDGLPLESPIAGIHVGLKALALEDLERVELVRGPVSALYGPGAVGGVVNLIPKRWRGAPGGEVQVGYGSHDTTRAAVAVGGQWERVDVRLSASDFHSDGYLAQPQPDSWGGRDLGPRDGRQRKYGLALGLRPADNQEITVDLRQAEVKSAWFGGHPNNRIGATVQSFDLGYLYEAGTTASYRLRYRHLRQQATPSFDVTYYFGDGDLGPAEQDKRIDRSDSLDLQANLRLGTNHDLTVGLSHALARYTTLVDYSAYFESLLGPMPDETTSAKSRLTGLYLQDEYRVNADLGLLLGGRWDRYSFYDNLVDGVANGSDASDNVFTPRIGARYRLNPATTLYATAGTAYVPAQQYLKYRVSPSWLDNPGLRPETSSTVEVGAQYRQAGSTWRAALFHTDYHDKIERITVAGKYQFSNVGKVTADGLELSWEGDFASAWRPYANYAWTDSRIVDNPADPLTEGKRLSYVARHKLNLGLAYVPTTRFCAQVAGRFVGESYFDDRNSARNPGHFVADAKVGWRLDLGAVKGAELSLAVNNLFDRRYREQEYEYMDGRTVWFGLKAGL